MAYDDYDRPGYDESDYPHSNCSKLDNEVDPASWVFLLILFAILFSISYFFIH